MLAPPFVLFFPQKGNLRLLLGVFGGRDFSSLEPIEFFSEESREVQSTSPCAPPHRSGRILVSFQRFQGSLCEPSGFSRVPAEHHLHHFGLGIMRSRAFPEWPCRSGITSSRPFLDYDPPSSFTVGTHGRPCLLLVGMVLL